MKRERERSLGWQAGGSALWTKGRGKDESGERAGGATRVGYRAGKNASAGRKTHRPRSRVPPPARPPDPAGKGGPAPLADPGPGPAWRSVKIVTMPMKATPAMTAATCRPTQVDDHPSERIISVDNARCDSNPVMCRPPAERMNSPLEKRKVRLRGLGGAAMCGVPSTCSSATRRSPN
jgi:hypothetical protein